MTKEEALALKQKLHAARELLLICMFFILICITFYPWSSLNVAYASVIVIL